MTTDAAGTEPVVVVTRQDGVLTLRMNRPRVCNAMSLEMYTLIYEHLRRAEGDGEINCVLVTGTGKYFSSGRDLGERTLERPAGHEYFENTMYSNDGVGKFYDYLARYRKPIITAVNGPAVGGGAVTAFLGDISIVADDAWFSLPELDRGVTAVGATMVFPRLISRAKGMLLILTCRKCSAQEAEHMGLVSLVVPRAEVEQTAIAMATSIAAKSGVAVRMFKTALQAGPWGVTETENIAREALRALAETTPERYAYTQRAYEQIGSGRKVD